MLLDDEDDLPEAVEEDESKHLGSPGSPGLELLKSYLCQIIYLYFIKNIICQIIFIEFVHKCISCLLHWRNIFLLQDIQVIQTI